VIAGERDGRILSIAETSGESTGTMHERIQRPMAQFPLRRGGGKGNGVVLINRKGSEEKGQPKKTHTKLPWFEQKTKEESSKNWALILWGEGGGRERKGGRMKGSWKS